MVREEHPLERGALSTVALSGDLRSSLVTVDWIVRLFCQSLPFGTIQHLAKTGPEGPAQKLWNGKRCEAPATSKSLLPSPIGVALLVMKNDRVNKESTI